MPHPVSLACLQAVYRRRILNPKFLDPVKQKAGFALLLVMVGIGCRPAERDRSTFTLHQYAFITNGKSDTVSVVNLRNFGVQRVLPTGKGPTGVKASPIRNEVYVVNTGSGTVSFVNAETLRVDYTLPVGRSPFSMELSPDGATGYVANAGSGDVTVVDLRGRNVLKTDRKSTRLNSSHIQKSRMPSSA